MKKQSPDYDQRALEREERGQGVGRVDLGGLGGEGQPREAESAEAEARPLAAAQADPEEALCGEGEKREAARGHDLDHRERRERHRDDVKAPRDGSDREADQPPLRAKEIDRALERAREEDRRGHRGAPVLAQHCHVCRKGGCDREDDA